MALKELYHPESGRRMGVAGLMSESGSNLRKIIEHGGVIEEREGRSSYQVIAIFSDNNYGRILMISSPLEVSLPEGLDVNNKDQINSVFDAHQNRLNEIGDWIIFSRTLDSLADGKYSQDKQGNLYFDNGPIPQGLRLETT